MKIGIGIDCRFWGIKHAGLGRYTRQLVLAILKELSAASLARRQAGRQQPVKNLTLFFQKGVWEKDEKLLKGCKIVEIDIPHYSFKEQLFYAGIVDKEKLDLIHFPHFNIPVAVKTPFVVTIHDLIKHFFKGKAVTAKSLPIYWAKHWGYLFIIKKAIGKARKIIVPSYFVKDQISVHYPSAEDKIAVVYEGVSEPYKNSIRHPASGIRKILTKYKLTKPFFVYTGSAYPFKDLQTLLKALENINALLLIACSRNVFWERLKQEIKSAGLLKKIILPGQVADEDLVKLYSQASAFVTPSLMEGFGLPGLEAMSAGCPVIASRTGSLPEIYQKGAILFEPQNNHDLSQRMEKVLHFSQRQREKQVEKGREQSKKYSWEKAAKETLEIYESCVSLRQGK